MRFGIEEKTFCCCT